MNIISTALPVERNQRWSYWCCCCCCRSICCAYCCSRWLVWRSTPPSTAPWTRRRWPTCWCSCCCRRTSGTTPTTAPSTPSSWSTTRPGFSSTWGFSTSWAAAWTSSTAGVSSVGTKQDSNTTPLVLLGFSRNSGHPGPFISLFSFHLFFGFLYLFLDHEWCNCHICLVFLFPCKRLHSGNTGFEMWWMSGCHRSKGNCCSLMSWHVGGLQRSWSPTQAPCCRFTR